MIRTLSAFAIALLLPNTLSAAIFSFVASNPGTIEGNGRDLTFEIAGVTETVVRARLELTINYDRARDLRLSLLDESGVVLPINEIGAAGSGVSANGRYVFDDSATTIWPELATDSVGNLSTLVPMRAYQNGADGFCLNHLARFVEHDTARNVNLTLRIERIIGAGGPGMGSISSARLVLETSVDQLFGGHFEGPAERTRTCQRPVLDLTLNGGEEGPRSPLVSVQTQADRDWFVRHLNPPFPEINVSNFGTPDSIPYAGRFGGRSRMNLGFWDPVTSSLSFNSGAGEKSLVLEGDWINSEHYPIPGDYDGDGITDLAMAFFANDSWFARILFTSNNALVDYLIDPRLLFQNVFSSNRIGFGPGQDADRNGVDEITVYARVSPTVAAMRMVQVVINQQRFDGAFVGPAWGSEGDRMILGDWSESTSGNRFGQMIVREAGGNLNWFRFPDNTPVLWGISGDVPISIDADGDGLNDIAVWRPSDQRWYVINSSDGVTAVYGPFGAGTPLGFLQGTIAPPLF